LNPTILRQARGLRFVFSLQNLLPALAAATARAVSFLGG
jgi:hypothetical protein